MAALDIRPHSHRVSVLAAAGLSLLAVVAFAAGVTRQLAPQGPSPFPPPQEASLRIEVANGVAPPPADPPRHSPRAPALDEAAETAQPPPGVDVSAVVADPPSPPPADADAPPAPQPAPAEDPPTP